MALGFGICRAYYRYGSGVTEDEKIIAASDIKEKINPSTKIIYEYYYPEDDVTETYNDSPSYFLMGYGLDELKRVYSAWDIISFSGGEVVMRKIVQGPSKQRYIIGEKDGYIAVFHDIDNGEIKLKEIIEKPVSSLADEDRRRIFEGVRITGDDSLARAIEALTS